MVLSQSVFNSTGLALVLFQFTRSKTHKASGAVINRIAEEVFGKVLQNQERAPGKTEDARPVVVLVFGTVEDGGIANALPVLTADGEPYKNKSAEPKIAQYTMLFMDDQFKELLRLCLEHASNDESG